ncbi:MAG: hypothetical protein ACT452_07565 [Microthrixaceae bacterium]
MTPRKRRGLLLVAIGAMFLVLATASGSPLAYLGAAIVIATGAAIAAGLPGFRGRD